MQTDLYQLLKMLDRKPRMQLLKLKVKFKFMNDIPEESLTISELAAELGIQASAIRFYEKMRLIKPRRTAGNQRVYGRHDRARLKLILRGKRFGATLDQIAEMIGSADETVDEKHQIEKSLYYINLKMADIEKRKQEIELFQADLIALKKMLIKRRKTLSSA